MYDSGLNQIVTGLGTFSENCYLPDRTQAAKFNSLKPNTRSRVAVSTVAYILSKHQ